MKNFEEEIKQEFLEEAKDFLQKTEEFFLELSELNDENDQSKAIDQIFRLVHNLKGSAAAVGFSRLTDFSHQIEELLSSLRKNEIKLTEELCLFLIKCNDSLNNFIEGLCNNFDYNPDTLEIEQKICGYLGGMVGGEMTINVPEQKEVSKINFEKIGKEKEGGASKGPVGCVQDQAPNNTTEEKSSKTDSKKPVFLRIESSKLDSLINYVGELVVQQSILTNHEKNSTLGESHAKESIRYMKKIVGDIRDISMSLRMTPLKPIFTKMNKIIKNLSFSQQKEISFITKGEEVELDKNIVEKIGDPLVHIIRNAVDHGIETPEVRVASGKGPGAKVQLIAEQKEDQVEIKIIDNGRGLSKDKIREKALSKNLISPSDELSDEELYSLIFMPGFSTSAEITDVSGRGVGMDVVLKTIENLNGNIETKSVEGEGTTFIIGLPLSLSIIQGMLVKINGDRFLIPMGQLLETLDFSQETLTKTERETKMLNLRGELIPIYSLGKILSQGKEENDQDFSKKGIITYFRGHKFSFEVDEIIGIKEIVIKKLGKELEGLPGIVGGAILENGNPGLILNLHDFCEKSLNQKYG